MMEVYGKWKWCAQCIHRVVNVEKQDGRVVGIDCCGVCPWSESWVYPSMDEKKSFSHREVVSVLCRGDDGATEWWVVSLFR